MHRDHRYHYGPGYRGGIYERLGPPPGPSVAQDTGRLGPPPQRVPPENTAYPTPYRQRPLNVPDSHHSIPPSSILGPPPRRVTHFPPPDRVQRPPGRQMRAFIGNRERMLHEYLQGPPGAQPGAGWRGRDAAMHQERSHVSKEMERSVFSLFQSEYRSEVEQSGPELLPVIPPASSPVDGKLSDNLRFVSDFVHGKMDTALPGEAGDVRQSAVAEGPYHHEALPAPHTVDGYLGRHATELLKPAPPPSIFERMGEPCHRQSDDFDEDDLRHSLRPVDSSLGGQPALDKFLVMNEDTIKPLFESSRTVQPDSLKLGFGSPSRQGVTLQNRPPDWQGQSWENRHVSSSPISGAVDAMAHGSVESRLKPLESGRSPESLKTCSPVSSPSRAVVDLMSIKETQPRSASQLVRRELHLSPRVSPDQSNPSVMTHQSESFHVKALPLSRCETQENALASWEKMPLDAVVQMDEKRSRSPAFQKDEQGKGIKDIFSTTGLPPHLSVVPMELDSGSQSESESSARGMARDSPLPHTIEKPFLTSRQAKDPIYVHSVFSAADRQNATGTIFTGQADVQREAAMEPTEGTSSIPSSGQPSPHAPSAPNKSLVVGISESGLAFRMVPATTGLPRDALRNLYQWSKGQMDKNISKKDFNSAHSTEVEVRTNVRLLEWVENNKMQLSHQTSTERVEVMKHQFHEEVRQDIKLILSSVVENLAIEELLFLRKTCPPRVFLHTTASYSKSLDCQLILEKAGYLSTRRNEPRVMSLFQKSAMMKGVLGKAKAKRMSVAGVLSEFRAKQHAVAAKRHRYGKGNKTASVGRNQFTEDAVACIEGTPVVTAGSIPGCEGKALTRDCAVPITEGQDKSTEDNTSVAGKEAASECTGTTTDGQEQSIEDHTVIESIEANSGGVDERHIENDVEKISVTNPERPSVLPSHDRISLDELVSGTHSPIPIPSDTRTQPDNSAVGLAGGATTSGGKLWADKQHSSEAKEVVLSGSHERKESTMSLEVDTISFAKPEFAVNGLSCVKRVSKEGVPPNLLDHLRKWAKYQFHSLTSSKQFNSVHSMEISIRTAVKLLDCSQSHSSGFSAQTIEKQRATLRKAAYNEVHGMLLTVKENVAVEEAKAVRWNEHVKQVVLRGSYQRKLCLDDLVQRMGYVVPRAEKGDGKAQDLLKKVDLLQLLSERPQRSSAHAVEVEGNPSSQKLPSLSPHPLLFVPTPSVLGAVSKHDTQPRDHSRGKGLHGVPERMNEKESRQARNRRSSSQGRARSKSRSIISTSSESDSSSESSEQRKTTKKKALQERRRSGHLGSKSRSTCSPRRSRSRNKHTSRRRESSCSETTHGDTSASPVRAARALQKRSRSCERARGGLTPSSDSETERVRQKYADEEDIKLLEMRRKLLQSILDKQQNGQELDKLPLQSNTITTCSLSPRSTLLTAVQPTSSNFTLKTSVTLNSSNIEAWEGVSASTKEPPSESSMQSQPVSLGHPSVELVASTNSSTFECISEDEDAPNADTGLQRESSTACGEMGAVLLPLSSAVGYTIEGDSDPMCTDSHAMETQGVSQDEELEEGEVVSSEDEAPLVIDYMEEGACRGNIAKRKQMAAKPSSGALSTYSTLTSSIAVREEAVSNKESTLGTGDSVSVCKVVKSATIDAEIAAELLKYQEEANAETSEEKLEGEPVSASLNDQEHPAQDMFAMEKATVVKDSSPLPQEEPMEESFSRQANIRSTSDIFQCDDGPQAGGSGRSTPTIPSVPSVEVSLDAFITQSKINSQLIQKAFNSSVVRDQDSRFAMETDSQQLRGSGRQVSGRTSLASAKFALGKKDSWKQTSSFIITVTEETTSSSEESDDDMLSFSSHPPLSGPTFDGVPPLSIGFKPRSILVSGGGQRASSAGTAKVLLKKSVGQPVAAGGGCAPTKKESKAGQDSSQEDTVAGVTAAPVKVGNSIKSSSLRLPQRRGSRAHGTSGSGDNMEVDAMSGKSKEPVEKQGHKRGPSTGDDGSHPVAKRRTVAVNAAVAQSEVKSPVKSQWKQVEHEVQEARRQLTRIRAKKCLQSVRAMEADSAKQRADVEQEQQRLNLLTQQLTSSTQEVSELEMKVDLLQKQLAQAKETIKTKQNRIERLQKEVKTTMTSLSDKKETLNQQTGLLSEERLKLKNFRDILKSGSGFKLPSKSVSPVKKRAPSVPDSGQEGAQLGGKGKEKASDSGKTASTVQLTLSSAAAAPIQPSVHSSTGAPVHTTPPTTTTTSQVSAQPVITNNAATVPEDVALSGSTDSSSSSSNVPISSPAPRQSEAATSIAVTTQAHAEGYKLPSLLSSSSPQVPPPQRMPLPTNLPSPNTVKRCQPIIALERLTEDAIRRKVKEAEGALNVKQTLGQVDKEVQHAERDSEGKKYENGKENAEIVEEKEGEIEREKFDSLHQVSIATDATVPNGSDEASQLELTCDEDDASSLGLGAGRNTSREGREKEPALGPTKSGRLKSHSAKMEGIVQRLRNQVQVGSTPIVVSSAWVGGESPRLNRGLRSQDLPSDALQADGGGSVAAVFANEKEEASLESTSRGGLKEWDKSPLSHPELMCLEGKGRSGQHSQMEPTYAGLPCIYLSRNGIAQLSERLRHVPDGESSETWPKLPPHVVRQLTLKSQGAPTVGVLPQSANFSATAASSDRGSSSTPSTSGRGLKSYSSPLLCLRSYIARPQFWRHHPYRLKSDTFMSRINPKRVMCRYGLQGVCRDSRCDRQHWKDITDASNLHVMEELALLNPQVCGIDVTHLKATLGPRYHSTLKTLVVKIINSHIRQVQEKGGDPLLELLHKIESSVGTSEGIYFFPSSNLSTNTGDSSLSATVLNDGDAALPLDRLQSPPTEVAEEAARLDVQQVFGGPLAVSAVRDPEQLSAQEGRYFAPSKGVQIGEMEQYLEVHPQDVETWLTLAEEVRKSFKDETVGLPAAIKIVKRALQSNPTSVRMHCQCIRLLHLLSEADGGAVGEAVSEAVLTIGTDVPAAAIILEHAWAHGLPSDKKHVCLNFIPLVLKHKCKEIGSLDAVELMIVSAQVDIVLRHPERAVATMKSFLSDHSSSLTPSHCVFTWLCYISVSRLGQLPSSLFTHRDYLDTTQPLRLLTKEPFIICFGQWFAQTAQLGQKQRLSVTSGSAHSTPTAQPPSTNLEALHQQWMESFSEALSSCMQNMAGRPAEETQRTLQPLWLSIAAVEEACGHTEECVAGLKLMVEASGGRHAFINGYQTLLAAVDADNASQVLASAYALHSGSPQMCHMSAKHEALHGSPDSALQHLVTLVECYLEQPCSEALQPHTAVLIYRKLLSQYVPGDQLASLPLLADQRVPREEVGHLWLCYCLLAELLPSSVDHNIKEQFADPVDVFEAAVHSQINSSDRKLVWKEYLMYLRDKASSEGASLQDFKSFTSCTQRCLFAIDHKETVAEENSDCSLQVEDYTFHNEVVEMHVNLLPDQDQPMAYRQWMKILPNSDSIVAKAALMAVRQSHSNIKWVQGWLASYLQEHSKSVAVWKIAIKLECSLKHYKEARWMFQEALKNVPLSGSLWKEYMMFEVDQMKDLPSTAAKQLPEGVAELFKNAAQNGIRVSDVMQPYTRTAPQKSS